MVATTNSQVDRNCNIGTPRHAMFCMWNYQAATPPSNMIVDVA
jgi:hypothetical protein